MMLTTTLAVALLFVLVGLLAFALAAYVWVTK